EDLPPEAVEIKPHPYGIELGRLIKMIEMTAAKTLQQFLMTEFVRVSSKVSKEICENSALLPKTKPKKITRDLAENLYKGIKKTKIMAPPTDCISPIGADLLERGLRKEINAEFYCSTTRPASVYRGNPFVVEAAMAYGGEQPADKTVRVMRFANRVPLLYQQGACGITKSIQTTAWKSYGLQQSRSALPVGPCSIVLHVTSVWVPFTSEEKSALAHYDELMKEMRLALQECGRKLASFVNKKKRLKDEVKKRSYIEKYIPHVAEGLKEIMNFDEIKKREIEDYLSEILEHTRGEIEEIKVDNPDYDPEFAAIGKEVVEKPKEEEKNEDKEENEEESNDDDSVPKEEKQTTLG
ncbi:DNA topoisomerase VI subunit B, partial [Candidatus Woesearchaeota archaeon]|nr:DNA topoisomerase VI subunit B [Candidatus Woesearchaeota archaeon]